MGSRNVEGVGGVLGLKAGTEMYKIVNYQKELDKRVIAAEDFTKAKQLVSMPGEGDAVYEQAHPAMKIAMKKVMTPYITSQIEGTLGAGADKISDWRFKMTHGSDSQEYRVSFYAPGTKKPEGTLTLKIGTKTIEGKKQYAVLVRTPSGKWQTFLSKSPGLKIDPEKLTDWSGDVGAK